jgi:hypothetical protein
MAAAALLKKKPKPTDKDIDEAMTNICRCGTYQRIRAAVHMAAGNGTGKTAAAENPTVGPEGATAMKKNIHKTAKLSRRKFIVGTAAAGGGLALGLHVPGFGVAEAQTNGGTEVNAWVVIKPDDTCMIRIARSEMGQGTLTGLAQLVAEGSNATGGRWSPIASPVRISPASGLQEMGPAAPGIRTSSNMSAGGAARGDAAGAATSESVGELTVSNGIITAHGTAARQGRRAAAKSAPIPEHHAQGSEGLKV